MAATNLTTAQATPHVDPVARGRHPKRSRLKGVLFRLTAIGFGVAFALLLAEIGIRLSAGPPPGHYQDGEGPLRPEIASAEGGYWRAHPGPARHQHSDYDVPIYVNHHGYRERDNLPHAPDEWRIGLFGDSMTAGWGVLKDQRFGEVWLNAVRDELPNTTLWNFGAPATGAWQNTAFLEAGAQEYELDEIILAIFGGNELPDNIRWSKLRNMSPAEFREYHAKRTARLRFWLRAHCRVCAMGWDTAHFLLNPYRGWYANSQQDVTRDWPQTERGLADFKEAVGDRPLTIWYLPGFPEWDESTWQTFKAQFGLRDTDRFATRDRLRQWAEANDVTMVDTTVWLAGKTTDDLKFRADWHWNAKGHQLVGEGLASTSESSYHLRATSND